MPRSAQAKVNHFPAAHRHLVGKLYLVPLVASDYFVPTS
jgi:hypothetical protein